MAGISVTSGQGSGAQAAVKTGHPPRAKISVTSGDVSGSQAGANIGQTPRTKVPAPISPGRIGASSSKVVTGLKRTATFSVSDVWVSTWLTHRSTLTSWQTEEEDITRYMPSTSSPYERGKMTKCTGDASIDSVQPQSLDTSTHQ
ncbi:hypothetical protein ScPMuIL_002499 [Solemya velum]